MKSKRIRNIIKEDSVTLTRSELQKYFDSEYEKKVAEIYSSAAEDICEQLMAVCMMELSTEFGFGKDRLIRFRNGVGGYFSLTDTKLLYGKSITTQDYVDRIKERYGISILEDGESNEK